MILSILICTTIEREQMFMELLSEFARQKTDEVEILFIQDNKEISVGKKRQQLLEIAKGDYIVYFDDDDWPNKKYVSLILEAIKFKRPDCLGYLISMTTNGQNRQTCCHSLKYKVWKNNVDGYDYVRNVTHFNVVKRELALKIGFEDRRWGEDQIYSNKITRLCRTEVFINEFMFEYRYSNKQNHNQKYGIK